MIFGYLLQVSTSTQCHLPKMAVGRMRHWEFNGRFDERSRQYPTRAEVGRAGSWFSPQRKSWVEAKYHWTFRHHKQCGSLDVDVITRMCNRRSGDLSMEQGEHGWRN